MNSKKHSRKDFLKRLGLSLTGATIGANAMANYTDDSELIEEHKEFLIEYEQWLKEFHKYVNVRNNDSLDTANNKRLMELSAQSEKRKKTLEIYMKDKKFAKYFNEITKELTEAI